MTIVLLALLVFVALGWSAEHGRLSVFLGRGIGSRFARVVLPIVLLLPFAREIMRARIMRFHLLPSQYAAGILAATGTIVALALLIAVSHQFRKMEAEIQQLSLRDELTGLYNLRGFRLLAEQALRVAHRSQMPFALLFVDVDNLKLINDRFGHAAGSALLVKTAELLQSTFRESDVLGRIGGDEFAVAGHFTPTAIEAVEERLAELSSGGVVSNRHPLLSLSMGHVMSDPQSQDSLQDLLDRADAAMYERKREKKLQAI